MHAQHDKYKRLEGKYSFLVVPREKRVVIFLTFALEVVYGSNLYADKADTALGSSSIYLHIYQIYWNIREFYILNCFEVMQYL